MALERRAARLSVDCSGVQEQRRILLSGPLCVLLNEGCPEPTCSVHLYRSYSAPKIRWYPTEPEHVSRAG
jgi:hypothetical protein